jgi:hypothetical protein
VKVINLFAGPGAGKSTTAAGLFHFMKLAHMSVELVTDHARAMTWERRELLPDQLSIFARQHRRIAGLKGLVDYVVTDAPLLMSAVYRDAKTPVVFEQLVVEFWNAFENCNFFLDRTQPWVKVGRRQTEAEARGVDARVKKVLAQYDVPYTSVPGDHEAADRILEVVKALHFRAVASPKWTHSRDSEHGIEAALGAVAAADAFPVPNLEAAPAPIAEALKPMEHVTEPLVEVPVEPAEETPQLVEEALVEPPKLEAPKPGRRKKQKKR